MKRTDGKIQFYAKMDLSKDEFKFMSWYLKLKNHMQNVKEPYSNGKVYQS
jgi:hypothetical protein